MAADPIAIAQAFCAAWNRHDAGAVVALFSDEGTVRLNPPPPNERDHYDGRDEIRGWVVDEMPGFHVDARDFKAVGSTVTFYGEVVSDEVRTNGVVPLGMDSEIKTTGDGKISSFVASLTPDTLARIQAAMGAAQG